MTEEDLIWLKSKLHGDDCRQCRLTAELIAEHRSGPALPSVSPYLRDARPLP